MMKVNANSSKTNVIKQNAKNYLPLINNTKHEPSSVKKLSVKYMPQNRINKLNFQTAHETNFPIYIALYVASCLANGYLIQIKDK